jgi:hypothetical protein
MPTEQEAQPEDILDRQPAIREWEYGAVLHRAGWGIAGVGSIAFHPNLPRITADTDLESFLGLAAQQAYEGRPDDRHRMAVAQETLEIYQEVMQRYGAERVVITLDTNEPIGWQYLAFYIKPLKGEHIDLVDTPSRNARSGGRSTANIDKESSGVEAHQPPAVAEGSDLNLSDHETGKAA